MTGRELIAQAQKHFSIFYLDTSTVDALDYLLSEALGTYQDKAGYTTTVKTVENETVVALPDKFLSLVSCHDAANQHHDVLIDTAEETITVQGVNLNSIPPYTITYFVNLQAYDPATGNLPPDIISKILEYLVALMDIPNTKRARRVALATGQEIELRSDEELLSKKQLLEEAMEEQHAILPCIMVC